MSENRGQTEKEPTAEPTAEDPVQRIKLERHLWPDEIEQKKTKKKLKRLRIWCIILVALSFLGGWLFGSFSPIPYFHAVQEGLQSSTKLNADDKFNEILQIMSNSWYFAKDIDNVSERLTDQALYGMTTNDEDPHTAYMSKDEIESFTQSINMNFVGIGVQFIANNGINMIEKVYKNSPAEKAGVQPGDILHAVDGTVVDGMAANDIKALVQGEAGTTVTIDFIRNGQTVTLAIVRENVSVTAYGKLLSSGDAYLEISQFGEYTPDEIKGYLDDFKNQGASKLIIDLRDNGGGYLDALQKIASYLLPDNTVIMQQEYPDGSREQTSTSGGQYTNFNQIVLLVNENTASASEVLTMALKEQRSDVTIIGTTTYGKGTVQITRTFTDGSALKYTTSKWLSPNGVWVNGTGITPDIEVRLHDVLYTSFTSMDEDASYATDSVSDYTKEAQLALDFLGYSVDRRDGYFSAATAAAIRSFEQDHDLSADGILNATTYDSLLSAVILEWNMNTDKDVQLQKAEEVLHG